MGSLRSRLTVTAQPLRAAAASAALSKSLSRRLGAQNGRQLEPGLSTITQAGIFKALAFKLCALPPRLGYSEA